MAKAFWQDRADTIIGGTGMVINFEYEAIGGGAVNVRMTRDQAYAAREALSEALAQRVDMPQTERCVYCTHRFKSNEVMYGIGDGTYQCRRCREKS